MILTVTVLAAWTLAAVAVCWGAHRARTTATPTPDPQTVELPPFGSDPDDDTVRVTGLPKVPPSERWTESDTAMFAWFAAGRSAR